MIYGLIPVGGKGTRLSLPFSKEMLPQKNFDFFNPVINHLVEKMEIVGASKIFFVHGHQIKQDIVDYFNDPRYVHVTQTQLGFATVLLDFVGACTELQPDDKVLFGLPDSVFDLNPFVEMLLYPGIVCGLFKTDQYTKVDRLNKDKTAFQVKVPKDDTNLDRFWGLLKFDGRDIQKIANIVDFKKMTEIGHIINMFPNRHVNGQNYIDLGTWENYNKYLADRNNFSNVEIEKKYDGIDIDHQEFIKFWESFSKNSIYIGRHERITSTDFYFTNNNPNIEFIRYREDSDDPGAKPDITIKNFNKSQFNRFELALDLVKGVSTQNVLHFFNLMGTRFEFSVTKMCDIFYFPDFTVVLYSFDVHNKKFKILEIELHTSQMSLISTLEKQMQSLTGFNPTRAINISKFQMIKQALQNDAAQ